MVSICSDIFTLKDEMLRTEFGYVLCLLLVLTGKKRFKKKYIFVWFR